MADEAQRTFSEQQFNQLQELVSNAILSRGAFLNQLLDPKVNINAECGYPDCPTPEQYQNLYDRNPYCRRVVSLLPDECWKVHPTISESDDPNKPTAFDKALAELNSSLAFSDSWYDDEEGSALWDIVHRADVQSGIGQYGVILMGLNDGLDMSLPVLGVVEQNSMPMDVDPKQGVTTDGGNGVSSSNNAENREVPRPKGVYSLNYDRKLFDYTLGKVKKSEPVRNYTNNSNPEGHNQYTNRGASSLSRKAETASRTAAEFKGDASSSFQSNSQYANRLAISARTSSDKKEMASARKYHEDASKEHSIAADHENKLGYSAAAKVHQEAAAAHNEAAEYRHGLANNYAPMSPATAMGQSDQRTDPSPSPSVTGEMPTWYDLNPQFGMSGLEPGQSDYDSSAYRQALIKNPQGRKLTFLRVFPETLAMITRWECNRTSPRFGMPVTYLVTFNSPNEIIGGTIGAPTTSITVHWTRVIHMADNLQSSEVVGDPRSKPMLNQLYNIDMILGASGKGYWRSGIPSWIFTTQPNYTKVDRTALKPEIENFMQSLQKELVIPGMEAKTEAPSLTNPKDHVDTNVAAICVCLACPVPVFQGYEIGEQASQNNSEDWDDRLKARWKNYLIPRVIARTVDTFIRIGLLPVPKKKYRIDVPDFEVMDSQTKAQVALSKTQAAAAYITGNVHQLIPEQDWLTDFTGFMSPDDAQSMLEDVQEQMDEEREEQDQQAQEQGFTQSPPDGYEWDQGEDPTNPQDTDKEDGGGE